MSDPIFTENGSVQVRLDTGVEITFAPTGDGFYRISVDDPTGAHYSVPATGEDMRAIRDATGMLTYNALKAAGRALDQVENLLEPQA
jgi:hypothetical protein